MKKYPSAAENGQPTMAPTAVKNTANCQMQTRRQ